MVKVISVKFPNVLVSSDTQSLYNDILRHLRDEILEFWLKRARDELGYKVSFGERGDYRYEHYKGIVSQARIIWAFLEAYDFLNDRRYLEFALHGVPCLLKFWDKTYKGWFWKIDVLGSPFDPSKRLYGQAFALLALAKLYGITEDEKYLNLYLKTLEVIHEKCLYKDGFYHEFNKSWKPLRGEPEGCWNMNSIMHFMEALMEGTNNGIGEAKDMLKDVFKFFKDTFIRSPNPHLVEYVTFEGDIPKEHYIVNIGHNLEVSWMFYELGESAISKSLVDFSIKNGWDNEHYGFFEYLIPYRRLISRDKVWWIQAEALSALSTLNLNALLFKQIRWCLEKQADHRYGEWYAICFADGRVKDPTKDSEWKVCYHNVRGLIKTLITLKSKFK